MAWKIKNILTVNDIDRSAVLKILELFSKEKPFERFLPVPDCFEGTLEPITNLLNSVLCMKDKPDFNGNGMSFEEMYRNKGHNRVLELVEKNRNRYPAEYGYTIRAINAFEQTGCFSSDGWKKKTWGTVREPVDVRICGYRNSVTFITENTPPLQFVKALSQAFPGARLMMTFVNTDMPSAKLGNGLFVAQNGITSLM